MARSTEKKQAIITAAIAEFKCNGFQTTSMDQIAHRAQVSKRTVYNHFASKDLLFDAIIKQMLILFTSSVSLRYEQNKPLAEQLTDIAEQEIRLLADPAFIDLAKVLLAEAMHSPERINQAMAEVQQRDGDLTSWVKAANQDNRLKVTDIDFAATQFFALIKAFCFWPHVIQNQPFPDQAQQKVIIQSAVSMFLSEYSA